MGNIHDRLQDCAGSGCLCTRMLEDGLALASMLPLRLGAFPEYAHQDWCLVTSEGVSGSCLQHVEKVVSWWLCSCSHGTYRPKAAQIWVEAAHGTCGWSPGPLRGSGRHPVYWWKDTHLFRQLPMWWGVSSLKPNSRKLAARIECLEDLFLDMKIYTAQLWSKECWLRQYLALRLPRCYL